MNKDIKQWLDGVITAVINNLNVINNIKNTKGEKGDKGEQGDKGIKGTPGEKGNIGKLINEISILNLNEINNDNFFLFDIENKIIGCRVGYFFHYFIVNTSEEFTYEEAIEYITNYIKTNININLDPDIIKSKIETINKSYTGQDKQWYIFIYYRSSNE